jgi:hypothetical protein
MCDGRGVNLGQKKMRKFSSFVERFQAYLWGGLLLFCGFIVWDTQMIIEKRRRGDTDYIGHSVDLFIDFIQVFRKIVIIMTQKVTCGVLRPEGIEILVLERACLSCS